MTAEHLDFDFFGKMVRVSGTREDLTDALFFYGEHLSPDSEPHLRVELSCPGLPGRGFFTSLLAKDHIRKRARVLCLMQGSWESIKDTEFTTWSEAASPLPPFRDSELWNRIATYSGAVLSTPDSRGMVITGDNYVGKTATSLKLYERGYKPISDSVIVLDTFNRVLQPYAGPIGFRRESLRANHEWIRCVDHRETISPDTGLVVLVRPDDVFPGRGKPHPVPFDLHVYLRKGHGKPGNSVVPTPHISWYTGVAAELLNPAVPEDTHVIDVPTGATPDDIADHIERAIEL